MIHTNMPTWLCVDNLKGTVHEMKGKERHVSTKEACCSLSVLLDFYINIHVNEVYQWTEYLSCWLLLRFPPPVAGEWSSSLLLLWLGFKYLVPSRVRECGVLHSPKGKVGRLEGYKTSSSSLPDVGGGCTEWTERWERSLRFLLPLLERVALA